MLKTLLSDDTPRSPLLSALLLAVVAGLLLAPFLFPGARALDVAAKICVFIVLAASYDLLLGYTGIVSFAHTLFFGLGAYGVAIASSRWGAGYGSLAAGLGLALLVAAVVAYAIGLFSLRVRAIFFAMITLAVASACMLLASQLSEFTGGEDGLNFPVPEIFTSGFRVFELPLFGRAVDGRLLAYYVVFAAAAGLFLALLRIVNSPFGRVLQAIRENDFRAEALGYRGVTYKSLASCVAALFATVAGALLALWLKYNGPGTTLSFDIMLDILVMVVIGGMGTLYGAVLGAALFVIAQSYLQDLLQLAHAAVAGVPLASALLHPDRWLLWLGVLFILSVYFFPTGIVGRLREQAGKDRP